MSELWSDSVLRWHHTHDGLFFSRSEDGHVRVRLIVDDEETDAFRRFDVVLTPAEWATVMTEMSNTPDGNGFETASRLHWGTLPAVRDCEPLAEAAQRYLEVPAGASAERIWSLEQQLREALASYQDTSAAP